MTNRQQQIADYIDICWQIHWTSPNVQQITDHLGLRSKSTAHAHLMRMVRDGIIERRQADRFRVLYRVLR